MNDLGILHYFIGIEVASSSQGYLLSQSKYIADLFEHARLLITRLLILLLRQVYDIPYQMVFL